MTTRNVSKQANALAKARDRRRALDKARDDQDQRIEEVTASALVALEVRADAERTLELAASQVGEVLGLLLAEGVSIDKAAALVELEVTEVRRLVKPGPVSAAGSGARHDKDARSTASVLSDGARGERTARRVR